MNDVQTGENNNKLMEGGRQQSCIVEFWLFMQLYVIMAMFCSAVKVSG